MNNMVGPSWKTHLAIKKKTRKWYLSYSELSSGLVNIFPLALLLLRQNKQHPFSPTPTSPKTVYELIPQGSSFIKKATWSSQEEASLWQQTRMLARKPTKVYMHIEQWFKG